MTVGHIDTFLAEFDVHLGDPDSRLSLSERLFREGMRPEHLKVLDWYFREKRSWKKGALGGFVLKMLSTERGWRDVVKGAEKQRTKFDRGGENQHFGSNVNEDERSELRAYLAFGQDHDWDVKGSERKYRELIRKHFDLLPEGPVFRALRDDFQKERVTPWEDLPWEEEA